MALFLPGLLEFQEEAIRRFGKNTYTYSNETYYEVGKLDGGLFFLLGQGSSPKDALDKGDVYVKDRRAKYPILWGPGPIIYERKRVQKNNAERSTKSRPGSMHQSSFGWSDD